MKRKTFLARILFQNKVYDFDSSKYGLKKKNIFGMRKILLIDLKYFFVEVKTCFSKKCSFATKMASDGSNTILSNIERIRNRTNSNIIFWTSNELEHVHLLVIELEHPIFGFERSNIELWTYFDPSLPKITFSKLFQLTATWVLPKWA